MKFNSIFYPLQILKSELLTMMESLLLTQAILTIECGDQGLEKLQECLEQGTGRSEWEEKGVGGE